jgi:hypothetical protein
VFVAVKKNGGDPSAHHFLSTAHIEKNQKG